MWSRRRTVMMSGILQMAEGLAGHADKGTYDQIPHDDAYQAYTTLQQELTPQQFSQAVQQYYEQASPEQRAELARQFQQSSQQPSDPQAQNIDPQNATAQQLAGMHEQAQQNNPDMLHELF